MARERVSICVRGSMVSKAVPSLCSDSAIVVNEFALLSVIDVRMK